MIRVYHNGGWVYDANFIEGETVGQFLNRFQVEKGVHYRTGAKLAAIDRNMGRVLPESELMVDYCNYTLDAWLESANVS